MKVADWISDFSGSLPFLFIHCGLFAVWIALNVGPLARSAIGGFDPFPFGLLTMVVSLEAIILSVFVLLSQNRQAARERVRNDIEYRGQPEGRARDRAHAREGRRYVRRYHGAPGSRQASRGPSLELQVLSLATRAVLSSYPATTGTSLALSPDGTTAFVTDQGNGWVRVLQIP